MIIWEDAVTDRSQADIDKVKQYIEIGYSNLSSAQKSEWLNGMKGAFNASDIERIENNVELLKQVLRLNITTYYNNTPTYPTEAYFANLVSNVETIRNAYCIHASTPTTPEMPINGFKQINDIEHILYDVYDIIMHNFHYYAGEEIYAGDAFGLLL